MAINRSEVMSIMNEVKTGAIIMKKRVFRVKKQINLSLFQNLHLSLLPCMYIPMYLYLGKVGFIFAHSDFCIQLLC